jgi:meso-butanediol dehydrogenase/(S,S)-butanediol dehydrogenase/diacetyl reductase
MSDFTGKVVVVTGAGSGIGEACCDYLRQEGATVIEWDLRPKDASNPAVDVSDWASVESAAQQVADSHGHIDALINCAGVITPNLPAQDVDPKDYRRNFDVNLMGIVHTTKALYSLLAASSAAWR